jgi:hypothetical protein
VPVLAQWVRRLGAATVHAAPSARPLWQVRWISRAPQLGFLVLTASLAAAGVRATFDHTQRAYSAHAAARTSDHAGVAAFAEAFARAYLTWDPADPATQRTELARLAPEALMQDRGIASRSQTRNVVTWTAVAADVPEGRRRTVTVEADTTYGLVYLELQIDEASHGRLRVVDYPAIVGGPPVDRSQDLPEGDAVEDASLLSTARRAVTNYLARRRDALAADLAPGSFVSLPSQPLTVRSLDSVVWMRRGRQVGVLVHAALHDGPDLALRYRLDVIRRAGRWFVQAVAAQEPNHEVSR